MDKVLLSLLCFAICMLGIWGMDISVQNKIERENYKNLESRVDALEWEYARQEKELQAYRKEVLTFSNIVVSGVWENGN